MTDFFTANLNLGGTRRGNTTDVHILDTLTRTLSKGDRLFILGGITDMSVVNGLREQALIKQLKDRATLGGWSVRCIVNPADLSHPSHGSVSRRFRNNIHDNLTPMVSNYDTMVIDTSLPDVMLNGLDYKNDYQQKDPSLCPAWDMYRLYNAGAPLIHGEILPYATTQQWSHINDRVTTTSFQDTNVVSLNVSCAPYNNYSPISKQDIAEALTNAYATINK